MAKRRRRRRPLLHRLLTDFTKGYNPKSSRWETNRPKKRKGKWLSPGVRK